MRPTRTPAVDPSPHRLSVIDTAAPLAVTVTGAQVTFDGQPLFAQLGLKLAGGAWTCVLGPSGVGKSTLLKLIAGLAPAAGATRIRAGDGAPLSGRVAYMAQQDLLLPWLSAHANVTLGARLRGERADGARAAALLERVGLADRAAARPAQLSGGERQRVALARTLMEDRPVVLMDEPFSALDAITRAQLQELAVELLRGRTVLLITHDPLEALRLGHDIHVLAGRPARLDRALRPTGSPPRDVVDAEVVRLHGELMGRLRTAAGLAA